MTKSCDTHGPIEGANAKPRPNGWAPSCRGCSLDSSRARNTGAREQQRTKRAAQVEDYAFLRDAGVADWEIQRRLGVTDSTLARLKREARRG